MGNLRKIGKRLPSSGQNSISAWLKGQQGADGGAGGVVRGSQNEGRRAVQGREGRRGQQRGERRGTGVRVEAEGACAATAVRTTDD